MLLLSLNDEHGFIIDTVGLATLSQAIIVPKSIVQNCIADFFWTLLSLLSENLFDHLSFHLVVTVIDSVRVKKNDVASIHQGDLVRVKRGHLALTKRNGNIPVSVRMIFGNLQPEGRELHHARPSNLHELSILRGEHKRGRVTESDKAEEPVRAYLPVYHGRDLAKTVLGSKAQCVSGCNGLCKSEVDYFEHFCCRFAVRVEFTKHCSMKCVMHRCRYLR